MLGGWQVSGILSIYTGTPFYVTANGGSLNSPGSTQTADQIAPVTYAHGINVGNPWFTTASFARTSNFIQGDTGRAIYSGPSLFALNASLSRTITIREGKARLQLRLETLNSTNTAQFSNPNTGFGSNFGFITNTLSSGTGVNGTGGGRVVQLGAKVTF